MTMHLNHTMSHVPTVEGTIAAGVAGALITGSMTAAREAREKGADKEKRAEFASNVVKESVTGGLAVAVGVAVAKTLFRSNILGIIAMAAVSAGAKYAIDEFAAKKGPGIRKAAGKAADKVSDAVKDIKPSKIVQSMKSGKADKSAADDSVAVTPEN